MIPPLDYLAWAIASYPSVRFDLGTSGLRPLRADEVAPPEELLAHAHDHHAPRRWNEALARWLRAPIESTVPTVGTTQGLWSTYAAILSPGDEVLVEAPVYEPIVRAAQGVGAKITHFSRDPAKGAKLDADAIGRATTERTKLVVVSNLHNPTGAYVDDATIVEAAKVARRVGAHLFVDEVYRDLVDGDGAQNRSAFHLAPNVIATSSLTKVYGLGWMRAGWVLVPPVIATHVRDATLHSTGGISPANASMGLAALARMKEIHARSVAARGNDDRAVALVRDFVDARPRLSWRPERGSIFGFVLDARGTDLRPAIERAVREEQVIVAPGSFFGMPSAFRLRYGAIPLDVLSEGLQRLGRVLDAEA